MTTNPGESGTSTGAFPIASARLRARVRVASVASVYADWAFERAGDALRHYQGCDRARGLAFVVRQFREQAQFGGVLLAPALFRTLLELNPEEVLQRAWDSVTEEGLQPLLLQQY